MIKAGVHYSFLSNLLKYVFFFIFNIFQSSKELSGILWGNILLGTKIIFIHNVHEMMKTNINNLIFLC